MNWKKNLGGLCRNLFYMAAAVQILTGIFWTAGQFSGMQEWQITYEYLDVGKTFLMDEYIGFLYPLLLKIVMGVEGFTGLPFYVPVYVLQLAAAVCAVRLFAGDVLKLPGAQAWWVTGYLTSFPLLLQFHLSVRPESLAFSGTFLLLWILWEKSAVTAVLVTAAMIWLTPGSLAVTAVIWITVLIRKMAGRAERKRLAVKLLMLALALLLGVGVNAAASKPGSRGRIQKTFWAAAFQRVVTDYFSRSYAVWDDEVIQTFTIEEAMEQAKRSDNMMYSVGPILEETWGKERANQLYRQMTLVCFRIRTREVVYRIRDDMADSLFMPFSVWWQKNGTRKSETGWNYERFRSENPRLSGFFWEYALFVVTVFAIIGTVAGIIRGKGAGRFLVLFPAAAVQTLIQVFGSGNHVDYSGLLLIIGFWCMTAAYGMGYKECRTAFFSAV